jgi:hypothetical protein
MTTGKIIAQRIYLHIEALPNDQSALSEAASRAARLVGREIGADFNVVKLGAEISVSLLDYTGFFDEGFPVLKRYWTVDLAKGSYQYRSYEGSLNPPILHRKELLLPKGHPAIPQFTAFTQTAEQIGLFDDPARIGFIQAWEHRKRPARPSIPLINPPSSLAFLREDERWVQRQKATTYQGLADQWV